MFNSCPLLSLTNALETGQVHSEVVQVKTGPQKRVSQQAARQAEWRQFPGDGTLGHWKPVWPLQWLWAPGFYSCCAARLSGFQAAPELKEEDETSESSNKTEVMLLTKIQPFFLNKHSSKCCKPLVNFQSCEKVDF